MFNRFKRCAKDNGIDAFSEHLIALLKLERSQEQIYVELRPIQAALLQGCIEFILGNYSLPGEYDSELSIVSQNIFDVLADGDVDLPHSDISHAAFFLLMRLSSQVQLFDFDDDKYEKEEGDDG